MRTAVLIIACLATRAFAQAPEPPPEPAPEPVPAPATAPTPEELAQRIDTLERQAEHGEVVEQRVDTMSEAVSTLLPLRRFLTVYIDVGWFWVGGDGSGVRADIGHRYIHDYNNVPAQWVLIGDPLSTGINARGEPADIGVARALETDTVNGGGKPGFIANSIGLAIGRNVSRGFSIAGLVEFLPRPGEDLLEVELAHIDYRPMNTIDLVLSVGMIDSVLGVEYRAQDAPRRLTVTPSLACRYTCGRPLGVQGRLVRGRLSASASITNGDNFEETFEVDKQTSFHGMPTSSGHLQWMLPVGQGLEVGVSGAVGPQDGQPAGDVYQWHYGVDLRLRDLHGLDVYAEYVQGKQYGQTDSSQLANCGIAQCLTYKAAYVLASHRVRPWLLPYARVDWRDARHQRGLDFLYVTRTMRATIGAHVEVTSRIIAKVEYTSNIELVTPQFPNDVIATSLVVSTD